MLCLELTSGLVDYLVLVVETLGVLRPFACELAGERNTAEIHGHFGFSRFPALEVVETETLVEKFDGALAAQLGAHIEVVGADKAVGEERHVGIYTAACKVDGCSKVLVRDASVAFIKCLGKVQQHFRIADDGIILAFIVGSDRAFCRILVGVITRAAAGGLIIGDCGV